MTVTLLKWPEGIEILQYSDKLIRINLDPFLVRSKTTIRRITHNHILGKSVLLELRLSELDAAPGMPC